MKDYVTNFADLGPNAEKGLTSPVVPMGAWVTTPAGNGVVTGYYLRSPGGEHRFLVRVTYDVTSLGRDTVCHHNPHRDAKWHIGHANDRLRIIGSGTRSMTWTARPALEAALGP